MYRWCLDKHEVERIRAHLILAGVQPVTQTLRDKFSVSDVHVGQVLYGRITNARIQNFVIEKIGFDPWEQLRVASQAPSPEPEAERKSATV